MVMLRLKKIDDVFSCFGTAHECDRRTALRCKTDNHDRSSFSQIKTILKRERHRADTHEMCVCVNVEQRVDARRRSCE